MTTATRTFPEQGQLVSVRSRQWTVQQVRAITLPPPALHTYLVTTLQAIVYELDRQPRWSMREALEHKRRLFEHVVTFFDSTDGQKISQQALLNSLACLETQREPFAWATDGQPIAEDGHVIGYYQI